MGRVVPATAGEIAAAWRTGWGEIIVSRGHVYRPADVEGAFLRDESGTALALVTWARSGDSAEVVSLDASVPGQGHGRTLLAWLEGRLREAGVRRAWLITTNDNVQAIGVYLRAGWRLVAVHLDALEQSRRLKPEIPAIGNLGLALRDEWEFEKLLGKTGAAD